MIKSRKYSIASFIFSGCIAAGISDGFGQWQPHYGFIGEGEREFSQRFNSQTYVYYGNHDTVLSVDGGKTIWEKRQTRKGRRTRIQRGRIHSLREEFDPPSDATMVVRTIGMLGGRVDLYGTSQDRLASELKDVAMDLTEWHFAHMPWTPKPGINWWQPQIEEIVQEDSAQLVECIRRELRKGITSTVYSIGNEPNLFPSLTPDEYARLYSGYYRIIKRENPYALIAMGNLFPTELVANEDIDELGSLMLTHGVNEYHDRLDGFVDDQNDFLIAAAIFQSGGLVIPISLLFESYGEYAARLAIRDLRNMVKARLLKYTSLRGYFDAVLKALPNNTAPSFTAYHMYALDKVAKWTPTLFRSNVFYSIRGAMIPFYEKYGYAPYHLITEFGNIRPDLNESEVVDRMQLMTEVFNNKLKSNWKWTGSPPNMPNPILAAYFYKPIGIDGQFSKIPGFTAPFSRIVTNINWDLTRYVNNGGNIPCADLNTLGHALYTMVTKGGRCVSP